MQFHFFRVDLTELVDIDQVGVNVLKGLQHYVVGRGAGITVLPPMARILGEDVVAMPT